jgi:putative oxidoreductase
MFYDHMSIQNIIGQVLLALAFLVTGALNATMKFKMHRDRMAAAGVPMATAALVVGFAMQFVGGALVLADWHYRYGAAILIVFTVVATAIFHRWWLVVDDPLRRHLHLSFVFNNIAVVGGLLLLM